MSQLSNINNVDPHTGFWWTLLKARSSMHLGPVADVWLRVQSYHLSVFLMLTLCILAVCRLLTHTTLNWSCELLLHTALHSLRICMRVKADWWVGSFAQHPRAERVRTDMLNVDFLTLLLCSAYLLMCSVTFLSIIWISAAGVQPEPCLGKSTPPKKIIKEFCNLPKEAANNSHSTITSWYPRGNKSLTCREHLVLTIWADYLGSLSNPHSHPVFTNRTCILTACTCMLLIHISHSQGQIFCFHGSLWFTSVCFILSHFLFCRPLTGQVRKQDFSDTKEMDPSQSLPRISFYILAFEGAEYCFFFWFKSSSIQ